VKTRDPAACGILEGLDELAFERCIPLNVNVELTLRCNIRCVHCYNFDRETPRPAAGPELSLDEIRVLFDELRRAGTLFLGLTGGEAMAHPRFWEIMDEAAARSFAVQLLSNGTLLGETAAVRLAAYPNLFSVNLSLYGATAAVHDGVTRSPGSWRRTMDGARRLRGLGATVQLKFVVMKSNAHEMAAVLELTEREGVVCSVDTTLTGRYDGTAGSLEARVGPETLEGLYRGPLRDLVEQPSGEYEEGDIHCMCARGNAAVGSTGDVYPCIATPLKAGNIREQGFLEIWRDSPVFRRIRGLRLADFKSCAPCELKPWCRRSPGPPVIQGRDFTDIDPWTCEEAALLRRLSSESVSIARGKSGT
jgi:radical SAM protein with 4Fe4S-binding SPASM domain